MSLTRDSEDRLSDLPPLPPLGRDEEALGPEEDPPVDGLVGTGDDEQVGLDASQGMPEGLDAQDLVDDLGAEESWTVGSEGDAGLLALDSLVEADEDEYGHTEDTEAGGIADDGIWDDVLESERPPAVDDGGDAGVDDPGADAEAGGDDDAVSLPPLDADEPEGLDDPTEDVLDLPSTGASSDDA